MNQLPVRARQMDDLVPNLTPRLWKNPSRDTVTLVVGHGEGHRGRALGKIIIPPGEEAYIERKYDKAVPFLAPQLVAVEPLDDADDPAKRPRSADDLVPVMTHTARPKKISEPEKMPEPKPERISPKPVSGTATTQVAPVKREDD